MAFRKTRYDSKRLAPCLKYSMWHCYRYRNEAGECIGCRLVNKKNWTKKVVVIDGVKMASCSTCGRMFPLSEYQMCTKIRYDRDGNSYRLHSTVYRCKECTRKAVRKSQERKKINGYIDIACVYNACCISSGINLDCTLLRESNQKVDSNSEGDKKGNTILDGKIQGYAFNACAYIE